MSTELLARGAAAPSGAFETQATFETQGGWRIHPSVEVRPEPFGALLYHFGTRRLTFLKDRRLLDIVRGLDTTHSPIEACRSAGVDDAEQDRYLAALHRLADLQMLVRSDQETVT